MTTSIREVPRRAATGWFVLLMVAGTWAYGYRLAAPALLDEPNDAQYAEVAREMVESGEWLSPQLDYTVFLNKPPLSYWLIAISYEVFGVNEFAARVPGALSALALLLIIWRLGATLTDEPTGLLAAGIVLGTAGVLLEARQVRPELLLATAIAGTLLACTRLASASPFSNPRSARLGLQVALATALLAKGIVGLLLPAAAVVVAMVVAGNFRLVRALLTPRVWWLFAVLIVPWHVVMGMRHPGFAWDYIVNQHFLFFLDRKVPRDSEGIALWQFWMAFALRLLPWTLLVPLAITRARTESRDERGRWAAGLLIGWLVAVMALFSATASRLEHYAIPALPPCALLIALLFRQPPRRSIVLLHLLPLAMLGIAAPFILPRLIDGDAWLAAVKGLSDLAGTAGVVLAVGTVITMLAAWRPRWVPLPLIVMMCALVPVMQQGLTLLASLNSSAPLANVLAAAATADDTLIYEAPIEYQSGAGLIFYTHRKWLMLRPTDFVSPPYLAPHEGELFIDRDELEKRWRSEHVFLVSNPLAEGRSSMKGIAPEPFWIIAHSGNRWIVSNDRP